LYLLPEIALTTQIVRRLREAFGSAVGIYHSRYSDAQRVETYYQMLQQPGDATIHIVLGARSAIFLPFSRLGLIIIDEEHENSYKQIEPAPRYHARDAAIVLGGLHGAKILLGSATPSFESYFNSSSEKYGLVKLNERYLKIELPDIEIANIREEYRKKRMKSHFSPVLLEEIDRILQNKLQVILFQNRRGFSLFLECDDCGWIPSCRSCDVSLTYHKQSNRLVCHYCGYSMNLPAGCPECTSTNLKTKGFGTEKIEDEIGIFFPKARIVRFDLDSARTRKQYEEIIHEFERGRTDILVGTQIISKGLDFDNVGLVGVMNADNLLNFPDFRAYERSFQLIAQVAGRAGRKKAKGRVIIQTSDPKNNVIQNVLSYNYDSFYRNQLLERQRFRYPPYFRLIRISMHHRKSDILNQASAEIASSLRKINDVEVLGPQYPLVGKIKNMFIKDILLLCKRLLPVRLVVSALFYKQIK